MEKLRTKQVIIYLRENSYWEVFFKDDLTLSLDIITDVLDTISKEAFPYPVLLHSENLFGVEFQPLEYISHGAHPVLDRLHVLIVNDQNMSKRYVKTLMDLKDKDKNYVVFNNEVDAKAFIHNYKQL